LTGHYNRFDLFTLLVDDRPVRRGPVYSGSEEKVAELHSANETPVLKMPPADQRTDSRPVKSLRRKR